MSLKAETIVVYSDEEEISNKERNNSCTAKNIGGSNDVIRES